MEILERNSGKKLIEESPPKILIQNYTEVVIDTDLDDSPAKFLFTSKPKIQKKILKT